jgi:hypothetical protein
MIKRHNVLENKVKEFILSTLNIEELYCSYDSTTIENLKKYSNKNKLFEDACSPFLTPKGNERKNEFVLNCPLYKINDRIECKSQINDSELIHRIDRDLDSIIHIHEDRLCIILDGAYLLPYNLLMLANKIIEKKIPMNKIWYGSFDEYCEMICEKIKVA